MERCNRCFFYYLAFDFGSTLLLIGTKIVTLANEFCCFGLKLSFTEGLHSHRNGGLVDMSYNIDRNMIFKRDSRKVSGTQTTTEHYYAGGYEKIVQTQGRSLGLVEHKYHLMGGNIVITHRSNGTKDTHYLHKDTQGSVSLITNESGSVIAQHIYDPFGKQTTLSTHSLFAQAIYNAPSHQGYTGHHELSDVGIVHMGGRIYDPTLGRFLQADPFVQAPNNTQNYNRYSYVLNNPMSYTDPSGYFFKKLEKLVKRYWKVAVAVGVSVFTYGAASGWAASWGMTQGFSMSVLGSTQTFVTGLSVGGTVTAGAIAGAAGGFVAGALNSGNLSGALRGALAGSIAGTAGGYANFGDVSGWGDAAGRIGVSALGGCAAGKASGGSCRKGASTAAMIQALSMGASELYKRVSTKTSKQTGQPYNSDGKPHLKQRGQSDVGKQLDKETLEKIARGERKPPLGSDQSGFMQGAAKGPYMDAFAEFHDGLHDFSFIPDDQVSLILTMPPSYAVTVLAAAQPYSDYYYLNLIRESGE